MATDGQMANLSIYIAMAAETPIEASWDLHRRPGIEIQSKLDRHGRIGKFLATTRTMKNRGLTTDKSPTTTFNRTGRVLKAT